MALPRTSVQLGSLFAIPVHLHYTVPVGAVLLLAFHSYDFLGALGELVGAATVILVHELGHAAVVRMFGQRVRAITLFAWGGECTFTDPRTKVALATIAWGGVAAQGLLLSVALLAQSRGLVPPKSTFFLALVQWLITSNIATAVLNLVPWPPLDGHTAWPLPLHLWRRFRARGEVQSAADRALRKALDPKRRRRAT